MAREETYLPGTNQGVRYPFTHYLKRVVWEIYLIYLRITALWRRFTFRGVQYSYFYHHYNQTFRCERVVEIPLIRRILAEYQGKRVLEIGNVLSHYGPVSHTVVDKYETGPGVVNRDIVSYKGGPFDLIVSISTLEHVGWDESPQKPAKLDQALKHLRSLLKPGGKMVFTYPLGANPRLDGIVEKNRSRWSDTGFLKRVSLDNQWQEATFEEVKGTAYNKPYLFGNAIGIVTLVRK